MIDQKVRDFFHKKVKLGNVIITVTDILLFMLLTAGALYMRYALRNVVAGDYKVFFEPWVATLREAGGGFAGLAAEFEYVDYTTPYLTILSFISICPFLNTLLLMKIVSIGFDFVAAIGILCFVYHEKKSTTAAVLAYGALLFAPTVVANGAMWAQCDIIFTSFIILSLLFIAKNKTTTGMIFYGVAFAFKLQTLFIAPLYVILWVKKKIKLQQFLWLPIIYFIGVIPSWIAGKNLWELLTVYLFQANGEMDIYALSHKFPNIYQIIGTDAFLREYADAGIWLTLAALMFLLYYFAKKEYKMTNVLMVEMGMFFVMVIVYFLPHMHERYAILVDVLAIVFAFCRPKKLYVPILVLLSSFAGYTVYLAQNNVVPLYVYAWIWLLLMLDIAADIYRQINQKDKTADLTC